MNAEMVVFTSDALILPVVVTDIPLRSHVNINDIGASIVFSAEQVKMAVSPVVTICGVGLIATVTPAARTTHELLQCTCSWLILIAGKY